MLPTSVSPKSVLTYCTLIFTDTFNNVGMLFLYYRMLAQYSIFPVRAVKSVFSGKHVILERRPVRPYHMCVLQFKIALLCLMSIYNFKFRIYEYFIRPQPGLRGNRKGQAALALTIYNTATHFTQSEHNLMHPFSSVSHSKFKKCEFPGPYLLVGYRKRALDAIQVQKVL